MMKNILCKIGFHKPDKYRFMRIRYSHGKHRWQRNYAICSRCGKRIGLLSFYKRKGGDG